MRRSGWARLFLVAGLGLAVSAAPASAATGPNNSWTQDDNGAWPTVMSCNGHSCSDPDCAHVYSYVDPSDGQTYQHGPCEKWPQDAYHLRWAYNGHNSTLHAELKKAMQDWSGQPYHSPIVNEANPCDICINEDSTSMPPNVCGWESDNTINGGRTTSSALIWINTNSNIIWSAGPPQFIADGQPHYYCSYRNTTLHEIGHSFSEGHSGVSTDLMSGVPCTCYPQQIDADADAELNAVYGAVPPCDTCQNDLGIGIPSVNYIEWKLAQLPYGMVPSVTNPTIPPVPQIPPGCRPECPPSEPVHVIEP